MVSLYQARGLATYAAVLLLLSGALALNGGASQLILPAIIIGTPPAVIAIAIIGVDAAFKAAARKGEVPSLRPEAGPFWRTLACARGNCVQK
jgi:hypothetical protein